MTYEFNEPIPIVVEKMDAQCQTETASKDGITQTVVVEYVEEDCQTD